MKNFTIIILSLILAIPALAQSKNNEQGCVSGDCKNGFGEYIYKDGTKYKGYFLNGLASGNGVCHYANGDYYIGEWKNHNFHGKGTLYLNEGEAVAGIWEKGELKDKMSFDELKRSVSKVDDKRRVWAVIVGVATYRDYQSLRYTDDDAYRLYSFFKSPEGGALSDEQISLLIDEEATKNNILEHLEKVAQKADENDAIIVYFSGHGKKGAFLPTDYIRESKNYIEYGDILKLVNESKAKNKVVIADVCHAGSMSDELAARGDIDETLIKYYDALGKSKGGLALVLSANANEQSIESSGIRQGLFSYFMIEGLKGKADQNGDQIVSIQELFQHAQNSVKHYTNHIQNPVITGDYDPAMPMAVIRKGSL